MISKICSGCGNKIKMFEEKSKCWYKGCKKAFCVDCIEKNNGISVHEVCKTIYCDDHIKDHGCIEPSSFEEAAEIKEVKQQMELQPPEMPEKNAEETLQELDLQNEESLELNIATETLLDERKKEAEQGKLLTSEQLMEKLFGKKTSDDWKVIPTTGLSVTFNNYDNLSRTLSFSIYSWVFDWYENKTINQEELKYVCGPDPFKLIDGEIVGQKDIRGFDFKVERLAKKYELKDSNGEVAAVLGDLFIFMMRKRQN